jgi:hypothetical protein
MTKCSCGATLTQANMDYCLRRLKMKEAYCYPCQMKLNVYRGSGVIPGTAGGHKGDPGALTRTTDDLLTYTLQTIATTAPIKDNARFIESFTTENLAKLPTNAHEQVIAAKVAWVHKVRRWAG